MTLSCLLIVVSPTVRTLDERRVHGTIPIPVVEIVIPDIAGATARSQLSGGVRLGVAALLPRPHRLICRQEHMQGNTSGFRLLLCQGNRFGHSHSLSERETVCLPFRQRARSRICCRTSGFYLSEAGCTLKLTAAAAAGIRRLSTFLSLMLAILLQLCSFHSLLRRVKRLSLRDENLLANFSMPSKIRMKPLIKLNNIHEYESATEKWINKCLL